IGERIRKRNTQLDEVGAGLLERAEDVAGARRRRIPSRDVGDETLASFLFEAIERFAYAPHVRGRVCAGMYDSLVRYVRSFIVLCTIARSLSPRPDRLMRITASRPSSRARRVACATACADSSAGRMPSRRASVANAANASSSVAYTYSVRPCSRGQACSGPTAA